MVRRNSLPLLPIGLIAFGLVCAAANARAEDNAHWLKKETQRLIEGCKARDDSGVLLHTPAGPGNYQGMWIREYYYVARYAGEFVSDANMKASIQHILDRQRKDGCIPNFFRFDGTPVYSVGGKKFADHALDNGSFMALAICEYVRRTDDYDFFRSVEPKMRRGLDHTSIHRAALRRHGSRDQPKPIHEVLPSCAACANQIPTLAPC
jgi:hypothetical protein